LLKNRLHEASDLLCEDIYHPDVRVVGTCPCPSSHGGQQVIGERLYEFRLTSEQGLNAARSNLLSKMLAK
jgi:hypothetical protein